MRTAGPRWPLRATHARGAGRGRHTSWSWNNRSGRLGGKSTLPVAWAIVSLFITMDRCPTQHSHMSLFLHIAQAFSVNRAGCVCVCVCVCVRDYCYHFFAIHLCWIRNCYHLPLCIQSNSRVHMLQLYMYKYAQGVASIYCFYARMCKLW